MTRTPCLTIIFSLLAVGADAQTMTVENLDAARAGVRLGYGGHGPDWDVSLDSPKLADAFRIRGGIGHGSWVGINQDRTEPDVTRFSAVALLYLRPRYVTFDFFGYVGAGVVALLPQRSDMRSQLGTRVALGMEGALGRWTIGPEVEVDLPRPDPGPSALAPTLRAGFALRRRF